MTNIPITNHSSIEYLPEDIYSLNIQPFPIEQSIGTMLELVKEAQANNTPITNEYIAIEIGKRYMEYMVCINQVHEIIVWHHPELGIIIDPKLQEFGKYLYSNTGPVIEYIEAYLKTYFDQLIGLK